MADRELLELAAKAVGMNADEAMWHPRAGFVWVKRVDGIRKENAWNPLTDDGDALRLAVNLRMRMHHDGACANVEMPTGQKYCWVEYATVEGNDHFAAMRCAIVRTAAEIGKAMP